MKTAAIRAIAMIDDENGISLSHLFAENKRGEWQAELDALTAKLAPKGATHSMRLVDVSITPVDLVTVMLAALKSAEIASQELCYDQDPANQCWVTLKEIRDAIAMAEGR